MYPIVFMCRNAIDLSMLNLSTISCVEIHELFRINLRTMSSIDQKIG